VVEVVWSRRALADLAAIQAHIRQFRPLAAQRMAQRLKLAAESLAQHPERGRPVGALRELAAVPPYLTRYRVSGQTVQIVRVRHGARRPASP
jgi:plasmid stabilization system protein ParE